MDKINKLEIGLLLLGLFIIGIGTYVSFTFREFGLEGMILVTVGVGIALSGFRCNQRKERPQRKKLEWTIGRIISLIGLIIFVPSLVFGLISIALKLDAGLTLTAIALCFLLGIPITLIGGRLMKSENKEALDSQRN
jgi:small-conductance mechanosensitive channel